ncbi:hypothetical protein IM793_12705 [Pedobacter sp. MR2016-19]|uniref:hypothetical protein n=1 Tax=Pedobacter sp. MR2016-19 TaxID=2780089 RepID=UPI001876401C|nr:hypothetical protein [Pedobacter sp. MR2016-19]MBE5320025.1 hypothetical protein [Pedobacter sp. MR2016-19]
MLKKINLGLVALVLGFGLIFTTSAFNSRTTTNWAYQQNSGNNALDYTKYVHTSTPDESCTELEAPLPCVIAVPEEYDTPTELQAFFVGKSSDDILDLSTGRTPYQ